MTPRIVITENPDAGVFAQKLNKYAIKIAGTPWNKIIKMVAPGILNYCQLLVEYKILYQGYNFIIKSGFYIIVFLRTWCLETCKGFVVVQC